MMAAVLPLPKDAQEGINCRKLTDFLYSVGNRPIWPIILSYQKPLLSACEVIKGHRYCELKPHAVMPLLTRHIEEALRRCAAIRCPWIASQYMRRAFWG